MTYHHLAIERDGGVAACRISNPPTHTLTAEGVVELHGLLDEIEVAAFAVDLAARAPIAMAAAKRALRAWRSGEVDAWQDR